MGLVVEHSEIGRADAEGGHLPAGARSRRGNGRREVVQVEVARHEVVQRRQIAAGRQVEHIVRRHPNDIRINAFDQPGAHAIARNILVQLYVQLDLGLGTLEGRQRLAQCI